MRGCFFGGMSQPKASNGPNVSGFGLRVQLEGRTLHFPENISE